MWAAECCEYIAVHVFLCHIDQGVREEEQTSAMMSTEEVLTEQRDALKVEIEHEQRVTMEVESWLKDRNVHLNKLHEGEINFGVSMVFFSRFFISCRMEAKIGHGNNRERGRAPILDRFEGKRPAEARGDSQKDKGGESLCQVHH